VQGVHEQLHILEWQKSNQNECLYENIIKKIELADVGKKNIRCGHLIVLFQEFGFLHSITIHKLVHFHGKREHRGHIISFVINTSRNHNWLLVK